jgi:hypothetical protein
VTTTTLARGSDLSYQQQAETWLNYINNGEYSGDQEDKLTTALTAAQETEFNALLPAGCHWHPHTGEIIGPVGTELGIDIADAMETAFQKVMDRFDAIEREALGL